jgi:hypothetical protein
MLATKNRAEPTHQTCAHQAVHYVAMMLILLFCGPLSAYAQTMRHPMQIQIEANGKMFSVTMADNPTARDFVSRLPMTLTLQDYAGTEKISDLPATLSIQGAPAGITPKAGYLTFYAPWGNLAIFKKDFRYSAGLIMLGTLDPAGLKLMQQPGPLTITLHK